MLFRTHVHEKLADARVVENGGKVFNIQWTFTRSRFQCDCFLAESLPIPSNVNASHVNSTAIRVTWEVSQGHVGHVGTDQLSEDASSVASLMQLVRRRLSDNGMQANISVVLVPVARVAPWQLCV